MKAGCRVQGTGYRVQGTGCKMQDARCKIQDAGSGLRLHKFSCNMGLCPM